MIVGDLKKSIQEALKTLGIEAPKVELEHPAELNHGDFSTNVALATAKIAKQKPRDIAEKVVAELQKNLPNGVKKIEVAGAGFINFYLTKGFFAEEVKNIGDDFGKNKNLEGKKVMVEYTDPNPFKPFHIGHLMSNAIGESIARLTEEEGAQVKRACWQGDIGLHVAKAIYALLQMGDDPLNIGKLGVAYVFGAKAYETDETAKKKIDELNQVIFEKADDAVNKLYEAGRKVSLEHFEELYKSLGTKFDYKFFEGIEGREGVPIAKQALKDGILEESDGAVVYRGEKVGLHTRVFLTSKGLPTYEAKELGLNKAKFKEEPNLDDSIIITANEQSDYFKVVLAAMREIMPQVAGKTRHIAHGMMRFSDSKMSSRKGNVITGESLIADVAILVHKRLADRDLSKEEKDKIAQIVAVGAIKYSILRQAIGGDIIFDFEKSISFEGDSGPYLQYSYVRAKSVLGKAESLKVQPWDGRKVEPWETTTLERLLYRFPEVVERAGAEYEPHYVTTYLTELAGVFNSWYANGKIIDAGDPASTYKLALTQAFAITMKNGLGLLGIKVPEKM